MFPGHAQPGLALAAISAGQIVSILLMLGGVLLLAWAFRRQSLVRPAESDDLRRLMAEATELAAALSAQLDERAERLQRLIDEADARLGTRLPRDEPAGVHEEEPRAIPAADPLAQRIFDLADEGLTPVQIAQRLDQHTGKVELILALRSR